MGNPLEDVSKPSEARGSGKWPIKVFEDQKSFGNLPGEFQKLRKVEGDSQSPRNTWQDTGVLRNQWLPNSVDMIAPKDGTAVHASAYPAIPVLPWTSLPLSTVQLVDDRCRPLAMQCFHLVKSPTTVDELQSPLLGLSSTISTHWHCPSVVPPPLQEPYHIQWKLLM